MEIIILIVIIPSIIVSFYFYKKFSNLKKTIIDLDAMDNIALKKQNQQLQNDVNELESRKSSLSTKIQNLEKEINIYEEEVDMQSFGLYKPQYVFANSTGYKDKLKEIRDQQKQAIKDKTAFVVNWQWTVNGSASKGKKMINKSLKQVARSFNNECEVIIDKVKYKNYDISKRKIQKSFDSLNKLNDTPQTELSNKYLNLKFKELDLAYNYAKKKEEEKETIRERKEKEREEKKLQQEIKQKNKSIDKDIKHYSQMVDELNKKIEFSLENTESIELQIKELLEKIKAKKKEKEDINGRKENASAGYVYIISNIGAFGKDIVKIGVTRRLDPYERIAELSSASVPFKFDVYAMIFSYNAYQLENELHHKFDKQRINLVNNRKEFFKIPISEIKKELEKYRDLTIDFNTIPDAEEYNETLRLQANKSN